MNKIFFFILFILFHSLSFSQKISGLVTDTSGMPLSFASIIIKGTTTGASANDSGKFFLQVLPGTYTIQCARVGFVTLEKQVTFNGNDIMLNFQLQNIVYNLKDVTVKSGGEDPAYEIMRHVIALRKEHENELKDFQCNVYIKGILQLRHYPKKFLGNTVDFGDADTSQKKIIFLSESIAKYSVKQPDSKIEVTSTKVSGNSDAFGFSAPNIISFYNNNIRIGKNLNPRGFISPLADDAFKHYTYKLAGTFFDNGKMIDRILVTPRQKFEPEFSGEINIIEDDWHLYSVSLTLLKSNALQVVDTLNIEQLYIPVNGKWLIKQQNLYPSIQLLGFDAFGSFVQVYDSFNLHPVFPKDFFGSTYLKFDDSSNKKQNSFWDSTRPIPLQLNEVEDYKRKDSLEKIKNTAPYMDSVDHQKNKLKPLRMLLFGQTFNRTRAKFSVSFNSIIDEINYNTVEGVVYNFSPDLTKVFANKQELDISPTIRYGFNNHHLNAHITGDYKFNKKKSDTFYFSGGRRVIQFNNDQPITPRSNTQETLLGGKNYLKIYEMNFANLAYTKTFQKGFRLTVDGQFQDRTPLENTTDYTAARSSKIDITPNYPTELASMNMPANKAMIATLELNWKPGVKYIEFPDHKIKLGSKYPEFDAEYTQGLHGLFGSDVNYSKWRFGIYQSVPLHMAGRFLYNAHIGGFISDYKLYLPDYIQFIGNQVTTAQDYLKSFQLMNYYAYSTTAPFYAEVHFEYHMDGLLSNKIPLFRKLNWFFVAGGNGLYTSDPKKYGEVFFSIENILKIGRIDFVQSFDQKGISTSGIRISLTGLINSYREN